MGTGDFLYAANFHGGVIDVFDAGFSSVTLAGSFTDPNLPSGFAPFNIQNIRGQLYVTYAKQDANGEDDVPGPGEGYVSVFDLNGNLVRRLISNGALTRPGDWRWPRRVSGPFGGDLLVGNFGDGRINAYDPTTGDFVDSLKDANGNPIEVDGLWALRFGNGGNGGDADKLYFSAGIEDEQHGLFGRLSRVTDGGATGPLMALAAIALLGSRRRD